MVLDFVGLNELQPGRLQPVNQELGDLFHQRVAEGFVDLAVVAQLRGGKQDGVGVLLGRGVEMPAMRRDAGN